MLKTGNERDKIEGQSRTYKPAPKKGFAGRKLGIHIKIDYSVICASPAGSFYSSVYVPAKMYEAVILNKAARLG